MPFRFVVKNLEQPQQQQVTWGGMQKVLGKGSTNGKDLFYFVIYLFYFFYCKIMYTNFHEQCVQIMLQRRKFHLKLIFLRTLNSLLDLLKNNS